MAQNFKDNTLYEMDNLVVLRGMNSETVDLIATDPPFNTKRNRSGTAGFYVDKWKWGDTDILPDQWKWNEVHPKWLEEIKDEHPELYQVIESTKLVQGEDTAAFLCFISVRLLEMHRVLKPTGSIYLHCDPTMSHYLKLVIDAVFGNDNFLADITWKRYAAHSLSKSAVDTISDHLLYYAKDNEHVMANRVTSQLDTAELNKKFPHGETETGRRFQHVALEQNSNRSSAGEPRQIGDRTVTSDIGWRWSQSTFDERIAKNPYLIYWTRNGKPRYKIYADEYSGEPVGNIWTDIPYLASGDSERTGSPDQKPLALYERIVKASSNEGDLVLDPFCGCATTIIAADKLKRRWIGIDRRKDARYHIITRFMGITRQEREHLEQYALDPEWLERQMQQYEMHYQTEPPIRTDNGEQELSELPQVYSVAEPENPLSHAEMKKILVERFELKCWGCNYIPPDERYLHLDHIIPKSEGGSNHIDNRALLCQPCNSMKSNTMSLTALRRRNRQEEHEKDNEPIDLPTALAWTRQHMIDLIRRSPHQYEINF